MKLDEIKSHLKSIPFMTFDQGTTVYNLILDNDISSILELGTAHGTSSCYMAAALDEKKSGVVITIDNKSALDRKPNVIELSKKCGLETYIKPTFSNSSYNWELMKIIDKQSVNGVCEPIFDFCYIDGAHNFEIDCCAFFLVDKLLKPNGFILFDDLNWSYSKSPSLKNTDFVKNMSEDERNTPHIKKLVDLIVLQHDNYHEPSISDNWFLIRKKDLVNNNTNYVKLDQLSNPKSLEKRIWAVIKKVRNKI